MHFQPNPPIIDYFISIISLMHVTTLLSTLRSSDDEQQDI